VGFVFRFRFGRGLAVPTFLLAAMGVGFAILAVRAQGFKATDDLQYMAYGFFTTLGGAVLATLLSLLALIRPQRRRTA
jgi:hypothetical protein